jgi:hypothetical protein
MILHNGHRRSVVWLYGGTVSLTRLSVQSDNDDDLSLSLSLSLSASDNDDVLTMTMMCGRLRRRREC